MTIVLLFKYDSYLFIFIILVKCLSESWYMTKLKFYIKPVYSMQVIITANKCYILYNYIYNTIA